MKFGITMPPFADFADVDLLVETAQMAERVGWDGFFIWDHIMYDPARHLEIPSITVTLAAIAMATTQIKLGAMITPLARRRPWIFAREMTTLDHVSKGRLIVGAGLGAPSEWDFGTFGEEQDDKIRAEKLDEGLDIVTGLWTQDEFSYQGEHYQLNETTFRPKPLQKPRIPIWIGGGWQARKPLQRAARFDGYFPINFMSTVSIEGWQAIMQHISTQRSKMDLVRGYDFVNAGQTPGDAEQAGKIVQPYADIGLTWWLEDILPYRFGLSHDAEWGKKITERMIQRIEQGPPRIA